MYSIHQTSMHNPITRHLDVAVKRYVHAYLYMHAFMCSIYTSAQVQLQHTHMFDMYKYRCMHLYTALNVPRQFMQT